MPTEYDELEKEAMTFYEAALRDHQYQCEAAAAGLVVGPSANAIAKIALASCYISYLVGKHGPNDWKKHAGGKAIRLTEDRAVKGQRVRYVPKHANGDIYHPDCEDGCVKRQLDCYVGNKKQCFVLFDNADHGKMTTGDEPYTAQCCDLERLWILREWDDEQQ